MTRFFAHSLARKLALAIVGLTLLVTLVQGGLSLLGSRALLMGEIFARLESVRDNRRMEILGYLSDALNRVVTAAKGPETTISMGEFTPYHAALGDHPTGEFDTSSAEYKRIRAVVEPLYRTRLGGRGFSDAMLVCAEHGHVMFTLAEPRFRGTNLATGPYRATSLARAWKRVVDTRKPAIEDYSVVDAGAAPQLYMAVPVFDAQEQLTAVLIEQLSTAPFVEMTNQVGGLGEEGELVLVGEDLLMRANPRLSAGDSILRRKADTPAVQAALEGRTGTNVVLDYRGVEVVAAYSPLGLKKALRSSFEWVLVAKQNTSEAFAPLVRVVEEALALGLGALLLAAALGVVLSRSMVKSVRQLATAADSVAAGDLESDFSASGIDEIGQLGEALHRMQSSLREGREARARIEEVQRRTAEYTRSLIEANLDPLIATGMEGTITDVNRATETATGFTRAELVGTDFAQYFTDPEGAREIHREVLREATVRGYPLELRQRQGATIAVLYNASVYKDESGQVLGVFAAARDVSAQRAADWLKSALSQLDDALRGEDDSVRLAKKVTTEVCTCLDAAVGLLYLTEDEAAEPGTLALAASYAYKDESHLPKRFHPGEGLVGQAALDGQQIILQSPPEDYLRVVSGLGEAPPRSICVTPIAYDGQIRGVLEIGTMRDFDGPHREYLARAVKVIGVTFETVRGRTRLAAELSRSQEMGEELAAQQQELKAANEDLQEQTTALVHSERTMQLQQEKLRVSNEELAQNNSLLERQSRQVEAARREIAEKAEALALASKYKSEFLANMSHELRTPLNSLLLLARGLVDDREGNLTPDQVESARVIHASGCDLLSLINEILDLAKIESGRMQLAVAEVPLAEIADQVQDAFAHMAKAQGLALHVEVDPALPPTLRTDPKRLQQVLKNLVSNALKFTEAGSVTVRFHRLGTGASQLLAIAVTDTGIGISPENQRIVFEAFQQVDGGTARKYGGTGLGLSISRELTRALGGELSLVSELGKGSTFTISLPDQGQAEPGQPAVRPSTQPLDRGADTRARPLGEVPDDRDALATGDPTILVIEDDVRSARIVLAHCRGKGFKCLVATTGEEGLDLARRHPLRGIILDLTLPGIDGWAVLETLKAEPRLRNIPVHIVSAEEPTGVAQGRGAVGHLPKPVRPEDLDRVIDALEAGNHREVKRLLIVEDDTTMRRHLVELLNDKNVRVDEAGSAAEADRAIRGGHYDGVILDLGLWDMGGDDLLRALVRDGVELPPVIINTARELTREEEARLREHAASIIIKDVRSEGRLRDEVSLFLHRAGHDLPPPQQRILHDLDTSDAGFQNKRVLVVDDDMRSAFALSRLLTARGFSVVKAENGDKALKALHDGPAVDLVLMDVMMPVMDGHEAIRHIRSQPQFAGLPIITLTAKAMSGDREKSLAAGANDYLTKPIDPETLFSMLRVWLCK